MDGCSGFSPDHHAVSISNIQLVCGELFGAILRGRQAEKHKKLQQPYKESLQPFFRNKKPQVPYLQTLVFLPHLSSSPDLRIISSHTAFSGFPNDRLSSNVGASTHTVAVPSGIRTRLSILLWGCYRIHRHLNGIFTSRKVYIYILEKSI